MPSLKSEVSQSCNVVSCNMFRSQTTTNAMGWLPSTSGLHPALRLHPSWHVRNGVPGTHGEWPHGTDLVSGLQHARDFGLPRGWCCLPSPTPHSPGREADQRGESGSPVLKQRSWDLNPAWAEYALCSLWDWHQHAPGSGRWALPGVPSWG